MPPSTSAMPMPRRGGYPTTVAAQLRALHAALHLAHTPEAMHARDNHHAAIGDFLRQHVDARTGGSMYISGAPGTGKTACVERVLCDQFAFRMPDAAPDDQSAGPSASAGATRPAAATKLLDKFTASAAKDATKSPTVAQSQSPPPRILYTNAMTLSSNPRGLYPRLLAQLRGLTPDAEAALSPMEAMETLKQVFCPAAGAAAPKSAAAKKRQASSSDDDRMTLVVLDEVDALLTTSPGVLYSLMEWPLALSSRLVVLAISNSINLLEQKLPHLVALNAMPTSLVFSTYSKDELKQIVQQRVDSIYPPEGAEDTQETPTSAQRDQPTPKKPQALAKVAPLTLKSAPALPSPPPASASTSASPRMSRSAAAKAARDLSASPPPTAEVAITVYTSIADIVEPAASPSKRGLKRKQQPKHTEASQPDAEADANMADVNTAAAAASSVESVHEPLLVTPKKKAKPASSSESPVAAAFSSFDLDTSCLAPLSTRAAPFFESSSLDLLCAKVAKGSGDLRKVLEVARKAVDALQMEWEMRCAAQRERLHAINMSPSVGSPSDASRSTTPGAEDRSDGAPSPLPADSALTPLQVSLPLLLQLTLASLGSSADQGVLLRSLPAQQKVVLVIACLLCRLQGGRDVLQGFPQHYARFSKEFALAPLRGHELSDLLAALTAHRLIQLVGSKKKGTTRAMPGSGAGSGGRPKLQGGSGAGKTKLGSGGGSGSSGSTALGSIQVNVTLEALHVAYKEDEAMTRLLARGKSLATAIIASAKGASAPIPADYVMRPIDE